MPWSESAASTRGDLAILRATEGRYDESEEHLWKAEQIAPSIRDPQAIAPMIGVQMCRSCWHRASTTLGMPLIRLSL